MQQPPTIAWHALETDALFRELETDPHQGLQEDEACRRHARFGPNQVTRPDPTPAWIRFLQQFRQALVYILLGATLVCGLLGEWADAAVILGVVLINAVVGLVQESKAEHAVDSLANMVRTEATLRRAGRRQRIDASQLVPGDIVILHPGDAVPADIRFHLVKNLQIDEAALTGESVPSQKLSQPLPPDTPLPDRHNMGFAGTLVTSGQAEGTVVATGDATEMGRIAAMISRASDLSTPLTRKIAQFSRLLLAAILALATLTFLVGVLRSEPISRVFMASVALAVAAIPEGLPAAITITLAIGVARMARRNAIIRKMPAVEALGSTTIICSDKTGTLTENQMTVRRILAGHEMLEVSGAGYEPVGDIRRDGIPLDPATSHAALHQTLLAGLLCNDSQIVQKEGRLHVEGDPTEAALITSAQKAGLDRDAMEELLPRLDVLPFESTRMFMATLHRDETQSLILLKGSVESVLELCASALDGQGNEKPIDPSSVHQAAETMAAEGVRVLAFARRHIPSTCECLTPDEFSGGFTFLGLQGMMDPPRPEATRAVAQCQSAGIGVKMITGDHRGTALAIGTRLGLVPPSTTHTSPVLTGRELEAIPEEQLPAIAEKIHIFARVAPEQKLRLVRALQRQGHVVAMTGDGVNDAPALKQADIGVAMGITGTDVSKHASDIVLTDDNFASIVAAVEEGRNVFDNLTKFITWTLPTNAGEGFLILTSIIAGVALPILPVQLLWINMSTALLLGLMLVFEPKESDLMHRPPRDPKKPILTPGILGLILLVATLMLAFSFGLFLWEQRLGRSLPEARTAVVNVVVMIEVFYLLNCRSLTRSFLSQGLLSNPWVPAGVGAMILAQALFTYAPFMNRWFGSAPIEASTCLRILGAGLIVFLVIELLKRLPIGPPSAREINSPMSPKTSSPRLP